MPYSRKEKPFIPHPIDAFAMAAPFICRYGMKSLQTAAIAQGMLIFMAFEIPCENNPYLLLLEAEANALHATYSKLIYCTPPGRQNYHRFQYTHQRLTY